MSDHPTHSEGGAPGAGDGSLDWLHAARSPEADREAKSRVWSMLCEPFFAHDAPTAGTVVDLGAGDCPALRLQRRPD
jgi:hypothetical protein